MPANRPPPQTPPPPEPRMPLPVAADLQDQLLAAANDLGRLRRLLDDASGTLMGHFYRTAVELKNLLLAAAGGRPLDHGQLHAAMGHLAQAITATQFQDLSSQLIDHTTHKLHHCAERLACLAPGDDKGEAVEAAKLLARLRAFDPEQVRIEPSAPAHGLQPGD